MKINYAQTDLRTLQSIAGPIGKNMPNSDEVTAARKDLRTKVINGLSRAVNAELARLEAAGVPFDGRIVFSLDFTFEFTEYRRPPATGGKRNLLRDINDILSPKTKKSKEKLLIF